MCNHRCASRKPEHPLAQRISSRYDKILTACPGRAHNMALHNSACCALVARIRRAVADKVLFQSYCTSTPTETSYTSKHSKLTKSKTQTATHRWTIIPGGLARAYCGGNFNLNFVFRTSAGHLNFQIELATLLFRYLRCQSVIFRPLG